LIEETIIEIYLEEEEDYQKVEDITMADLKDEEGNNRSETIINKQKIDFQVVEIE
jgi:hypothetical protein